MNGANMTEIVDTVDPSDVSDDVNLPVEDQLEPTDVESTEPVDEDTPIEEPVAAGLSPHIAARAAEYGLSVPDLEGFDDARVERIFASMDRRSMRPQDQPGGTPAPEAPSTYTPLTVEFSDDVDEAVVKSVQPVVDHINTAMQDLHAFRKEVSEEIQAMNTLRELSDLDRFVEGLGEEWVPTYGTGATADMDPRSAEFKARMDVFHGTRTLTGDAAKRGDRLRKPDAHLRSHRGIHYDRMSAMEKKALSDKIAKKRKGSAERPVKGKTATMSPREAAAAAWNKKR